jgi:hypothetical protein
MSKQNKETEMLEICLFLFCPTLVTPIKSCPYIYGPRTEAMTDKAVDTVTGGGYVRSVCGDNKTVLDSELYKLTMGVKK